MSVPAFETLLFDKQGPIARITLNRPAVVNAFNVQMRDDLWEVLHAVRDDPDVRAVVLRGAGLKGFCTGADLTEFGSAPSQEAARRVRWERDVFGLLLDLPKPTLAALHGHVIGSGVEIACLCDIRVAADDAQFSMPETSLGLVPAAGGTQTLPRLLRPGRASEMLLAGWRLDAAQARRWGLVQYVASSREFDAAVDRIASRLAALDSHAAAAAKRAVKAALNLPLAAGLDLEGRELRRLLVGAPA